jgi:nicotinate-nucleotide pyrophosphorylase (carboxylating)
MPEGGVVPRAEFAGRFEAAGIDPGAIGDLIQRALAEDLDGGVDVTSVATVGQNAQGAADFAARADGVIAGLVLAAAVLDGAADMVGGSRPSFDFRVEDGASVRAGDVLLGVSGPARALLTGERTALNLLSRLSGVATLTRRWVDEVAGTGARIRDTRKTTPGLRRLEKYAVRCGGGVNHRMSLSDAALVKDNHVIAAGGLVAAFEAVRSRFPGVPVEVEVDTADDAVAAVEAGADLVLLDNMTVPELARVVELVDGRAALEASGGLRLDNARDVAQTGVDFLAVGALTHSAPILDIALDFR